MVHTIDVKEIDRQLAEARAITLATLHREYRAVKVLSRERISGAWRIVVEVNGGLPTGYRAPNGKDQRTDVHQP